MVRSSSSVERLRNIDIANAQRAAGSLATVATVANAARLATHLRHARARTAPPLGFDERVAAALFAADGAAGPLANSKPLSALARFLQMLPTVSSAQAAAMRAAIFRIAGGDSRLPSSGAACGGASGDREGEGEGGDGAGGEAVAGAGGADGCVEAGARRLEAAGELVALVQQTCLVGRPSVRDALFFPGDGALDRLLRHLNAAKFSIDVCVYCLTGLIANRLLDYY